jgi:acyl-coenzyme A synthetase/AMP-(fatty) acid ligase
MSIHTAIILNAILDLGVILAVAATMFFPFTLDRRKHDAEVYAFATPLPEHLAA